jgi:hypothetical protein
MARKVAGNVIGSLSSVTENKKRRWFVHKRSAPFAKGTNGCALLW